MPARKTAQTEKPTFIFKGTIKQLKRATMKAVPVDKNTAVVTVDQVVEAPPDLAGYNGQDLTVQLSASHKAGETLIFNTVSWLYGDSVAVRSLSEEPIKPSHSAMLAAGDDPAARRRQREQREHFNDADLVVSGKVVAVRLPGDEVPAAKGAMATTVGGRRPVSEHDPKWREAVVEIDDVHKGDHKKKQVVIRFPASNDVMWYNAPKFHPGQQGHFLLTKAKAPKEPKSKKVGKKAAAFAATKAAPATDTYVALDPIDFQPYSEPGGIKTMIDAKSS